MIKKIISDLTDDEKSLVNPLLKTKVFASRIGNQKLLDWVNKEINGYSMEDELPKYRKGSATTSCTLRQGYAMQENIPVPILYIKDDELKRFFVEFDFRESIKTLETYLSNKDNETITKLTSIDFWALLTREMRKAGLKGEIRDIKKMTHISTISQTLTEARNRFLDLMLSLESEYPDLPNDSEELNPTIKEKLTKSINIIMGDNYSIINKGKKSLINTGNSNQIKMAIGSNISQNDIMNEDEKAKIESLTLQIKDLTNKIDLIPHDKEDISLEVERIVKQLTRDNPKKNIISESLNTTHNILSNLESNPSIDPVINDIEELLSNF